MKWFYALNNERHGPVTASSLGALVADGTIERTSLVWREGMENWQPFSEVPELAEAPKSAPAIEAIPVDGKPQQCMECGFLFPASDLLQLNGHAVCPRCKPVFVQKLREGVVLSGSFAVWRRKREIIVPLDAHLPARCVKCNCAVDQPPLKRLVYWHHPALYLLIFFPGLLVYLIVALIVRKKATVHVGLCDEHRRKRQRTILWCWLLALGGVAAIFLGANLLEGDPLAIVVTSGIGAIIIAGLWGALGARLLYAVKIDKQFAYLRGACRDYLDALPEWTRP